MVLKRCPSFDEPRLLISPLAGDLDLIVGENKGRIFFFNNTGGSAARAEFTPRSDGTGDASMFSDYTALNGDVELDYIPVLADLDNDGDLDIVVGEYKARISYLENIGSASAPQFVWRRGGDVDPFDGMAFGDEMNPALADLDGDGDFDLAVGDKEGIIKYYENTGSAERPQFVGRTGSANPFEGVAVDKVCAPRFVDIDGDGDLDLVTGEAKGGLTVYENKASSAVAPVTVEIAGAASPLGFVDVDIHASAAAYSAPTLVDYDGDNDLDVVVGHAMAYDLDGDDQWSIAEYEAGASALTFFFYENVGSSVAPAFVQKTGSESPFALVDAFGSSAASFGDMDKDGDVDLVVGDIDGYIFYYESIATVAGFVARQGWANPFQANFGVRYSFNLALCDLDGDRAAPRCLSRVLDRAATTNVAPSQATSTSSSAIPRDYST